jgi:anti-sigma regulatory factor (Ser/Thr protein kinase)
LEGLVEHLVWSEVLDSDGRLKQLPKNVRDILSYVFTEMLNNAIDHSNGTIARISWWIDSSRWAFAVEDDGAGAFPHVAQILGLADSFAAVQELTKGKTTTDAARHSGEGIFFTSKAVDVFSLSSDGLRWTVDNLRQDEAVGLDPVREGTVARCEVDPTTDRELTDVFRRFTDEEHRFSRSRTTVSLFGLGVRFVSRSEAKRLLHGLERFREVEVDFTGVREVGQGFVDELFRVWPTEHPDTAIIPTGMNEAVEFMVHRGLRGREGGRPQVS